MAHKMLALDAQVKTADDGTGTFSAVISAFGNVDLQGDRVMPGAFGKTLARWREKGRDIPIVWAHNTGNPFAIIGKANPNDLNETENGLVLEKGVLDLSNEFAGQVHNLMKQGIVDQFSFSFDVPRGGQQRGKDGANELTELDVFEIGPCFRGANPATELLSVKTVNGQTGELVLNSTSHASNNVGINNMQTLGTSGFSGTLTTTIPVDGTFKTNLPPTVSVQEALETVEQIVADGEKAGAALSRANRDRLSALRQRVSDIGAEIDDIIGTDDGKTATDVSEKTGGEPTATPTETPDETQEPTARDFEKAFATLRRQELRRASEPN